MELKQKLRLKYLLLPELRQSLKILVLAVPDLKNLLEQELLNNPFLEELEKPKKPSLPPTLSELKRAPNTPDLEVSISMMAEKTSLHDALLRQLGMFANTEEELKIGQEIIGNIDQNGYLKTPLEEVAFGLSLPLNKVEPLLKLIQQFEPAGVAARDTAECLFIQLELTQQDDPLTVKIVRFHLQDIAKKDFSRIAKCLKEPIGNVEASVKKILKLDPKPGRNYAAQENTRVIPDIIIDENDKNGLTVDINNEDMPSVNINRDYRQMLKDPRLDPQAKEFLKEKLRNALELLRAIDKRQSTLRKVVEAIVEIQSEAFKDGLSYLKPLTFQEVAQKIGLHESTVCRVVMNKYAQTPHGIVALKDFFTSRLQNKNGEAVSSNFVRHRIKELIGAEDKKHPLSDQDIAVAVSKEDNLKVARRTVAKYREELKLLPSAYRKAR